MFQNENIKINLKIVGLNKIYYIFHNSHIYMYMYCIYIYIYIYIQFIPLQRDYLCQTSLKANVATDEGKDRNET